MGTGLLGPGGWQAQSRCIFRQFIEEGSDVKPLPWREGRRQAANPEPSWSDSRGPPLCEGVRAQELESKEFCRNPCCQQRIKVVAPGIVVLFGKTHLQILKRQCVWKGVEFN